MIFNLTTGTTKTPVLNTSYPANVTVTCGEDVTFKVEITEPGIPAIYTYQWYVNNTAVSGATSDTYKRNTASDKGIYSVYCIVSNVAGAVVSRTATLKVNKTPVLNKSYPENASVIIGNSITLNVAISTAGYPTSYTYQWYWGGENAFDGATSSTFTFTPSNVGSHTIYCKVTNSAGTVTTRKANITCTPAYLFNNGEGNVPVEFTESGYGTEHWVSWNADSVLLYVKTSAGKGDAYQTICTVQEVGNYSELIVKYAEAGGISTIETTLVVGLSTGDPAITLNNDYGNQYYTIPNAIACEIQPLTETPQSGELVVDISSISGTQTVFVALVNNSSGFSGENESAALITEIALQ